jgi:hypothetical protein
LFLAIGFRSFVNVGCGFAVACFALDRLLLVVFISMQSLVVVISALGRKVVIRGGSGVAGRGQVGARHWRRR